MLPFEARGKATVNPLQPRVLTLLGELCFGAQGVHVSERVNSLQRMQGCNVVARLLRYSRNVTGVKGVNGVRVNAVAWIRLCSQGLDTADGGVAGEDFAKRWCAAVQFNGKLGTDVGAIAV